MAKHKKPNKIIPLFMAKNPDDVFKIVLPFKLKLCFNNYANSKFRFIVENCSKKYFFTYSMSPELLFTHFPVQNYFSNGNKLKDAIDDNIQELSFDIDTSETNNIFRLKDIIQEEKISTIFGGVPDRYLDSIKYINCFKFELPNYNLIIPHFAVAIYYYFRSTDFRESVLNDNLESMYQTVSIKGQEAIIVSSKKLSDADAAFIHRFACQEYPAYAFKDVSAYIQSYLKYMKEKHNEITKTIPIKVKFPITEKFKIDTRATKIFDNNDMPAYFVHEVTNDYSNLGFTKLIKILQKNNLTTRMKDITSLPIVESKTPENTTEILREVPARRGYSYANISQDKDVSCGSLQGIEVEDKEESIENIITILHLKENILTDTPVDQTATESTSESSNRVRRVIINANLKKDIEKSINNEHVENFEMFDQYINFLQSQSAIKNLIKYDIQTLPQFINKASGKVKSKCQIHQSPKRYITATFEYNNLHVGLLDLENTSNTSASSWVIVSKKPILQATFYSFLCLYFEHDITLDEIKRRHKTAPLKFITKNHEHVKDLSEKNLIRWTSSLLGKLFL